MKAAFFALIFIFTFINFEAAAAPWQPTDGNSQIPIWPGAAPEGHVVNGPEDSIVDNVGLIAGKPWTAISNVSTPTITIYTPKEKKSSAAVVVFPGGGYDVLAIDLEGTEICDWFMSKGITCALLKYRVPRSGPQWNKDHKGNIYPKVPAALQDAQRAIRYLRYHAAECNVDPNKIGVIGFSAGGHLVAAVSTNFQNSSYIPIDAVDRESSRPDFAIALYPGHLSDDHKTLNKDIHVTAHTSPTMLIQAMDDPVDPADYSIVYFMALKSANVPVEMHLFAQGGHAFGLRLTDFPITNWPELAEKWMVSIGAIPR